MATVRGRGARQDRAVHYGIVAATTITVTEAAGGGVRLPAGGREHEKPKRPVVGGTCRGELQSLTAVSALLLRLRGSEEETVGDVTARHSVAAHNGGGGAEGQVLHVTRLDCSISSVCA